MADDSVRTTSATFKTREAADLAIEHLVQQHGISRADNFVQSKDARNTAGTMPSGGDAAHEDGRGRTPRYTGRLKCRPMSTVMGSQRSSRLSGRSARSRFGQDNIFLRKSRRIEVTRKESA